MENQLPQVRDDFHPLNESSPAHSKSSFSPSPLAHFTPQQVDVLRRTIAKGATDDEFFMFASLCARYQLDPFNREVWFVKYGPTPLIMTSRDGYLKICQRDPDYLGISSAAVREGDEFELCPGEGRVTHRFGAKRGAILGAWAMVKHRKRDPVICFADFAEYDKSNERGGDVWKRYPSAMICKVAEVMALKRQGGIAGLVTQEEMRLEPVFQPSRSGKAIPEISETQEEAIEETVEDATLVEFRPDPALKILHTAVKSKLREAYPDPRSAGHWLLKQFQRRRVIDLSERECHHALKKLRSPSKPKEDREKPPVPKEIPLPSDGHIEAEPRKSPSQEERIRAAREIMQSVQKAHTGSAPGSERRIRLAEIEDLELRLWPEALSRPQRSGQFRRNYLHLPTRLEECNEEQLETYRQALETCLTADGNDQGS
jgi:phage recombination protein Bet